MGYDGGIAYTTNGAMWSSVDEGLQYQLSQVFYHHGLFITTTMLEGSANGSIYTRYWKVC